MNFVNDFLYKNVGLSFVMRDCVNMHPNTYIHAHASQACQNQIVPLSFDSHWRYSNPLKGRGVNWLHFAIQV